MKASTIRKIIAAIMVMSLFIVALIIPANAEDAATEKVHVLESKDLAAIAQGAKADGDTEKAGTDGFFTIHYSAKTKIDSSSKTFEDDYTSGQRINFGGKGQVGSTTKNVIQFTTEGAATVKVWWVEGGNDNR